MVSHLNTAVLLSEGQYVWPVGITLEPLLFLLPSLAFYIRKKKRIIMSIEPFLHTFGLYAGYGDIFKRGY